MKNIFYILLLIVSTGSYLCVKSTPQIWCNQLLQNDPTNEELTLMLNVLYWSYARSNATCAAQQAYLKHIEHALKVGQNIHHTRLNPSRELPYKYALAQSEQTYTQFIQKTIHYHLCAATYTEAVDYILHFYPLSSNAQSAIENLRLRARKTMAHAATEEASDFLHSFDLLQNLVKKQETKRSQCSIPKYTKRSIISFIASWVPLAAVSSFIAFDTQFNTITEQWWKALMNAYELNNSIWNTFEAARAHLYKTYYAALYNKLKTNYADETLFLKAFDEHGFIALNNRTQQLPTPDTLHV